MKGHVKFAFILSAAFSCVFLPFEKCRASSKREPTPEEIAKITAAIPSAPRVQPAKPRKVLVNSISYGYYHTAIPYGQKAFEIMGEKTGAFEATVTDDISMFEPEKLKQFDAVIFNSTNREIFLPEDYKNLTSEQYKKAAERDQRLKKSLADFISSGKGLAVIHAGSNCFLEWPEFGNILGARFDNHPWESGSTVVLKVEEPEHPVAQAFKQQPIFKITDEVYQHKEPYSREHLRILLSIDVNKTYVRLDHVSWVHRKDNDFAISWVKNYGKGRVFYCALGHEHEIFWNPVVLQHYLDGIQFALGDLKADTTPSAKLQKANPR